MKQSGFNHRYSQLGDVASCSEMKMRKVIISPATPDTEYMTVVSHRVNRFLLISLIEMDKVTINRIHEMNNGLCQNGVGGSDAPCGNPSFNTVVSRTNGTCRSVESVMVASCNRWNMVTGA